MVDLSNTNDRAGNMIYGPKSGDETTGLHYVRDAWNRQVAVYEDDGDGQFEPGTDDALIAAYEFDAVNRRIEKVLSTSHAHYYYNNSWQLLEERFVDGQGATLSANQHVFSPDYIDSPIVWRHDANGDGDYADQGDMLRYYLSDANHNTTAVVDFATGLVVNRYVYNAYGSHTVYDANWSNPTAPTADGIMYCGYWYDAETGNYLARNRFYNTALATWISRDPIGYLGGQSLSKYCGNRPTNATDPDGLNPTICCTDWTRRFVVLGYTNDQVGAMQCTLDKLGVNPAYAAAIGAAVAAGTATVGGILRLLIGSGGPLAALYLEAKFLNDFANAEEWSTDWICTKTVPKITVRHAYSWSSPEWWFCWSMGVGRKYYYTRECPKGSEEVELNDAGTEASRHSTSDDGPLPAPLPGNHLTWPYKPTPSPTTPKPVTK